MNKWKFCSHVPYWATQNVQIWSRDKCQSIEDRPNERKWTYDSVVWEPPNFERWLLKILLSRVPLCKVNSRLILECIEFCYWKSFSAVYVRWEYFFSLKEKGLYQYCFKKKNKTKPNQTKPPPTTKQTNNNKKTSTTFRPFMSSAPVTHPSYWEHPVKHLLSCRILQHDWCWFETMNDISWLPNYPSFLTEKSLPFLSSPLCPQADIF